MRQVANKWAKFTVLNHHAGAAKHIPSMLHYSESNLQKMLREYGFVVAKPFVGAGGHGVVKLEKVREGGYRCHYFGNNKKLNSWKKLVSEVNKIRNGRRYMLQRGIRLVTINGRPVDYRVKIVKKNTEWKITAVVARHARPGLFVTNLCRGGNILQGTVALRHSFSAATAKLKKDTMCGVARTCTHLLESKYPGIRELGFDFGIDNRGTVWILEVNTRPQ